MRSPTYPVFREQFHGYRNGHQLLAGDIDLAQDDQDTVDRLSDISGQLRPGERFDRYFTSYPLPSQSFYVVAVTRQDLAAPRAGCVRTHSLFIPMAAWIDRNVSEILDRVFDALASGEPDGPPGSRVGGVFGSPWPLASQSWAFELVEAMFLEQRAPIAVFEAKEADLATFRLLAAIWPSLRRALSVCTFALAPRSIAGKSFDLVFAPKAARSRFSEWSGRRIDATAGGYSSRHRWTSIIAREIFEEARPSLYHFDDLRLLDQGADEARFRMTLLWKELVATAQTTPQAVLGLVDIFMTAKPASAEARESLSQAFQNAVFSAKFQLSDFDFWQFIIALVEKFQGRRLPKGGLGLVRSVVRARATTSPRDCISALSKIPSKETIPKILAAAIGDGLNESEESLLGILNALSQLGPIGEEILSASRSLIPRLVSSIDASSVELSSALHEFLSKMNLRSRRVLLRRSVSEFDRAAQADVLGLLLQGTTRSTLSFAARAIGQNTGFTLADFNSALIDAAKSNDLVSTLQSVLLDEPKTQATGRVLKETLTLSGEDFDWLKNSIDDDWYRAWILSLLIDSAAEPRLRSFGSNSADCAGALLTLSREAPRYSTQMTRLLILPEVQDAVLALHGVRLAKEIKSADPLHTQLLSTLVRRLVSRPDLIDDVSLRSIVETYAEVASDREFTESLFLNNRSEQATVRALEVYRDSSETVKRSVYGQVEAVTDSVLRSGLFNLNRSAVIALAEIIELSGGSNRFGQARASGRILNACFEHRSLPIGDLVIASFPVVYSEVASGTPGFNLLNLFFPDWDHCKTIRKQLVDSYVQSVWSPVGLLVCAWRVHDVQEVFRYLRKSYAGRDYFRKIQEDLHRYAGPNRDALSHVFSEAIDLVRADDEKH